jgi:hypothetical protein
VEQNGDEIQIDAGTSEIEIVDQGPWWKLKGLGSIGKEDTVTIYAVTHDLTASPSKYFPVLPVATTLVYFRTDLQLSAEKAKGEVAPGVSHGLIWPIGKYSDGKIIQYAHGNKIGTASMGDAEVNGAEGMQDLYSSSIQKLSNRTFQILDFASKTMTADDCTRLVVRKGSSAFVSGISDLKVVSPITLTRDSDGFTFGFADGTSGTETAIEKHTTGESALKGTGTCDETHYVTMWVTTGVVYDPSKSYILYEFKRMITFPNATKVAVSAEEVRAVFTPEYI